MHLKSLIHTWLRRIFSRIRLGVTPSSGGPYGPPAQARWTGTVEPFFILTFEALKTNTPRRPLAWPAEGFRVPFPVSDPFGLRKAVWPVFKGHPGGKAVGIGTAFHIDGWGGCLTADHVVDFIRDHLPKGALRPGLLPPADWNTKPHPIVLLGYGVVFGTVVLPPSTVAPLVSAVTPLQKQIDPMAELRGESGFEVAADVAGIGVQISPEVNDAATVAVDLHWQPAIGEPVFALGFPELDFKPLHVEEVARYLSEGMFGAYGLITDLHPEGRSKTNPTPVFETDAHWPSGMSGGPVFNRRGNVVGVVSRSLEPSDDGGGVGYAAWLSQIPEIVQMAATLNLDNPSVRKGFGVLRREPWDLKGVFRSQKEADVFRAKLGPGFEVAKGHHRLGTTDFLET